MIISSLENSMVKDLVKLQKKKYRDLTNTYIVEGEHLVKEAIKTGLVLKVFVLEGISFDCDYEVIYMSSNVMKKISSMDSVPPVMALVKKNNNNEIIGKRIVLLDGIQDPGNLGTIIRSSLAFNVDTIIMSNNCVDLYNHKVIRATQGLHFNMNIITMDLVDAINIIKNRGITVYGTDVVTGEDVTNIKCDSYALVMGSEGLGVSDEVRSVVDKNLYIKMNSLCESLNVGVACSILIYELGK